MEDRRALLVGIALAEQLLEHRARIAFLRQRLRRRAPGDCAPPSAVVSSSDGSRVSWPMCRAANWSALTPASGPATPSSHGFTQRQPRHLDVAVRLGRFGRLVAQTRDDRQVLAERLQRLEDRRHLVVGARLRRRPAVHDGAVREPDEREALRGRAGRRLRPRGGGGIHRIQQRQRDAGPRALQHRPPRNVLLEYVHRESPLLRCLSCLSDCSPV